MSCISWIYVFFNSEGMYMTYHLSYVMNSSEFVLSNWKTLEAGFLFSCERCFCFEVDNLSLNCILMCIHEAMILFWSGFACSNS